MKYKIYENGEQINVIVADEEFCKTYCDENGYTYEKVEEPARTTEPAESEPSIQDDIDAMLVDQEYRITMLELGITA